MKADLLKDARSYEQTKARKALLHGCAPGFEVVSKLLQERLQALQVQMLSAKTYESPSWALMQADKIGEARGLAYVIDLLTLDREKE